MKIALDQNGGLACAGTGSDGDVPVKRMRGDGLLWF
jgi:hypothetical protein